VLHCDAVCCSVLQYVADIVVGQHKFYLAGDHWCVALQHVADCCSVLQQVAV